MVDKLRLVILHFLLVAKFKELICLSSLTKQCWAGCSQPFIEVGERAYSRFQAIQLITKAERSFDAEAKADCFNQISTVISGILVKCEGRV